MDAIGEAAAVAAEKERAAIPKPLNQRVKRAQKFRQNRREKAVPLHHFIEATAFLRIIGANLTRNAVGAFMKDVRHSSTEWRRASCVRRISGQRKQNRKRAADIDLTAAGERAMMLFDDAFADV